MSNDELFVDGVPLHERPDGVRVDWVGEIYPANADPEVDSWNGKPMEPTPSLAEFLLTRIAEDEERVRQAIGTTPRAVNPPNLFHNVALRHLGDCEAKRLIVERHRRCGSGVGYCDDGGHGNWLRMACPDLEDLALPYADHPDYRKEWRA